MVWLGVEFEKSLFSLFSIVLLFLTIGAQALSISFCSNQNTGSGSSPTYNHFQSNGACQDSCQSSYAYAILQGSNCWCSNYAPGDQTDSGSCNEPCPGFQSDLCGNQGQGLFGYYQLANVQPSGTIGASPSASPTPSSAPSSLPQESPPFPSTVTVQATVTDTDRPNPSVSVVISVSTANPPAATSPSSSPSPSPTSAAATTPSPSSSSPMATPTPSTIVTSVLGSVRTVIITPSRSPEPAQTQVTTVSASASDDFFNNTAKVAGTFTGVAVGVILLIGLIVWFFIRRRRSRGSIAIRSTSDGDRNSLTNVPFGAEKRNSKLTLNTAGLGGVRRGDSHEKHTAENTPASMSRRTSIPLTYDQRLDPGALFGLEAGNGSHVSVASLRDDRDYSRSILHVRNPD